MLEGRSGALHSVAASICLPLNGSDTEIAVQTATNSTQPSSITMQNTTRLLTQFVQGIRVLTGARAVSLYVPNPHARHSRPTLIHDGIDAPIAELADVSSAHQFVEDVDRTALVPGPEGLPLCLPSVTHGGAVIPLPGDEMPWGLAPSSPDRTARRRTDLDAESASSDPGAWLGLRLPPGRGSVIDQLQRSDLLEGLRRQDEPGYWWSWLFTLGGALASHSSQATAFLRDPMTGLADRREFQALLAREIQQTNDNARSLSLLMINPDDFLAVNDRFGREQGDLCVREFSDRILQTLRVEDRVARYGSVIFAAILPDIPLAEAQEIAERLRLALTEKPYLDGTLNLKASIGCSAYDASGPEPDGPLELVQRADRALSAAKRSGGNRVKTQNDEADEDPGSLDRLSGIFTGNMDTDYRNMVLLWDTVNVIALDPDFDQLVSQVVERLYTAFKPTRVGVFSRSIDDQFHLMHGFTRQGGNGSRTATLETLDLGADQLDLLSQAIAGGSAVARLADVSGQRLRCCAVPLIAGNDCLGCLYLDGRPDTLGLDASDLVFFRALGSQIATAMDRTRLAEIESRRQEQEKRMLRAELKELRQALQQAKLVYRSPQMESLVATAHRVASTDATVLITGASGTGKELLARTVHELSPRRGQPFVIVDCGAIPTTLIESELFGSEKGAYTGAQARRAGRLAEANYGTVLLDEIGELPLEVQTKLLRFVQEKQLTRVGGTRQQKVDVRILAATNRNLKSEVAAGRFREDLYYRLNVIHLAVPPLRDRPEDILHLANHFLEIFSVQYQKNVRRITPAAASALTRHTWPGNVRELQNRVMQAVILCEGNQLGPDELGLSAPPTSRIPLESSAIDSANEPTAAGDASAGELPTGEVSPPSPNESAGANGKTQPWTPRNLETLLAELRQKLAELIYSADNGLSPNMLPLGRWLDEDLLVAADTLAEGIARRAALTLGLAETTFRRRLQKAKDRIYAGLSPRVADWEDIQPILTQMVRSAAETEQDLIGLAQRVLLEEIVARFPSDVRTGSALLAVSSPTYRKRLAELRSTPANESSGDTSTDSEPIPTAPTSASELY